MSDTQNSTSFQPLVVGGLYTGISRSLHADILAADALGGNARTVCTMHIVASHGTVTDVLPVPADTVDAQLQHLLTTTTPTGVKLGILGGEHTISAITRRLASASGEIGPIVLDATLSGPSGEDIIEQRATEQLVDFFEVPDLVTLRRRDAELLASMEIGSMDDAQVAIQRLHKRGARRLLLRCGSLPNRFYEAEATNGDRSNAFSMDLYYDGDDFGLFEAPQLDLSTTHGASSAFTLALLRGLVQGHPVTEAIQLAKGYVSETLRHSQSNQPGPLNFHWQHRLASSDSGQ